MKRQKSFNNDLPKLYIVATPIGNLRDMTYRAVDVLKSVDIIFCEDTRTSQSLLKHYDIDTPLHSYHLFNENEITKKLIDKIKAGQNVAVISDAGLPCISDPGWVAVKEAIEEDIDVVVIPGASAGISALVASGLPTYKYLFVGFLNSKKAKRKTELKELLLSKETIVMYESPHRIEETLKILSELCPDRCIVLARELTKKFEEYYRGTPQEILEVVDTIKGEIVLIIEGKVGQEEINETPQELYEKYLKMDMTKNEALKQAAKDLGISKNDLYKELFENKK